jgi:hypothetical protein
VAFCIGVGIFLKGFFLSTPPKTVSDKSLEADQQRELDQLTGSSPIQTNELQLTEGQPLFTSITEHTTHQLAEKERVPRN